MSSSLYWSVIPKPKEENINDLKYILAKKLWDNESGCSDGDYIVANKDLIPFLEGIEATGSVESQHARKLINAINKHGEVNLSIY